MNTVTPISHHPSRPCPFGIAFATAVALACVCVVPTRSAAAQSRADTTFAVARNAVVNITVRSGDLHIRGADRSTIEQRGGVGNFDILTTDLGVTITARYGRYRNGSRSSSDGDIELIVPRTVRLVISAGTGNVTVEDISSDVEVHALSGDIELHNVGGRTIVESMSGDLTLHGGNGDARITTMSGDITVRDLRGDADVHTTSGTVSIGVRRAASVRVDNVSGDINVEGDVTDDARLQLVTHSGDVSVRIPDTARGIMDVSTFNGEIASNRTLTLMPSSGRGRGERATQRYEFGGTGGGIRLSVTTFNGDVTFERTKTAKPE